MASYNSLNSGAHQSPYGSGDPYYSESTGYITPRSAKKNGLSNWIKFGVPVLVVIIVGAVIGGVLGSKNSNSASSRSSSGGAAGGNNNPGRYATATNSLYLVPVYPSTTNTAAFTTPTFISNNAQLAWPTDSFQPSSPNVLKTRPDRPRLIAPAYKWQALPNLINSDPYLRGWNDTIFGNATEYLSLSPVQYFMDDDSGILDNSRYVKERIKALSYVYRMTNDSKWAERAWVELQNAAGNGTTQFGPPGPNKWNPAHFLDTAEMSSAFGIAYDWLYDYWSSDQKSQILSSLLYYGLQPGLDAYTNSSNYNGWWKTKTTGNWNCVCNAGLTMASLAILGDDTTGIAKQLLGLTIDNAKSNCAFGVTGDGSWTETPDYWYFGTTGHAELASVLLTATGSHYGLLDVNSNFWKTGFYHMYVFGPASLFGYGDSGPNKYSSTANSMLLYGAQYNQPQFTLFQREQFDAADPWSMFWYNPTVRGAFWDGLALDYFFDNSSDQWASMRSSWTDENALYVGIKAGMNQGHQTHNDLDAGDFVLDALGTRWAGELGDGDYRSPGYFSNDTQGSARWMYYRKMTEGQNTILIGRSNQNVLAAPKVKHDSSNTVQGSSTVFTPADDSTVYWIADLTSAYFDVTSVKRGLRLLHGRSQVLLQDEINSQAEVMWRMHTNATVQTSGTSATLTIEDKTMQVSLLNAPSGAVFTTNQAVRFSTDPTPPVPDQPNVNVTVLTIDLPAGMYTLQVLFSPQWNGTSSSSSATPPSDIAIISIPLLFFDVDAKEWTIQRCVDPLIPRPLMLLKTSQHLSITLFFYFAFFVLFVSRADAAIHAQPNHRRLLRKRMPQLLDLPGAPGGTSSAGSTTSAALTQSTPTPGSTDDAPTASVPTTASQISTGISASASQSTFSASPSSTSSSPSSTVSSISTSGASLRSSLMPVPSPTDIITGSGVSGSLTTDTSSSTVTSSSSPSSSAQAQAAVTSSSNQKTVTAIIVVTSGIGGIAILWTLFRKWKLGRSSKFDERLQPIDWQPPSDDNRRPLSTASSFHSGGHGFGTEPHDHVQNGGITPLPDHDFTVLPSGHLAAVGGYADLARGPSPQPPMQEAYGGHNPVTGGPNYDVNVPLHHQGGYGGRDAYNYASMRY
ncbi:hypothetical protein APHAL10511_006098 [Amanita phalloides]|nr:hypothetical protein APHAL10511_006098 [Amanita phalloides]